jgi:hypothetical protein
MRPSRVLASVALFVAAGALAVLLEVGREPDSAVAGAEGGPRHPDAAPIVAPAQTGATTEPRVPADPERDTSPVGSAVARNRLRDRTAAVLVRAISEPSGDPAAGLGVTLSGLRAEDLRRGTTDGAGLVAFEELRAGRKAVSGAFAGQTIFTLDAGERRTVDLVVPQGATVRLTVTTREDVPVAGASVLLSSYTSTKFGSVVATTD